MGLLIAVARRCIKQAVLARASRHRLGNQQFWMLVSLAEYPGQSQVEVGERLRADAPTVSRMVAGLSRRRLVRVALDARDRRRSRLTLTAEGERLALEFREVARELRACMVDGDDGAGRSRRFAPASAGSFATWDSSPAHERRSPARTDRRPPRRPPEVVMRSKRWVMVVIGLALLVGGGLLLRSRMAARTGVAHPAAAGASAAAAQRPVPVMVAPVARRDVPIYLEGLGSVAAFKTVTVRSQVDGRLDQVLFTRGPGGPQGRRAGADRSAPVPDPAPAGAGRRWRATRPSSRARGATSSATRSSCAEKLIAQQQVDDRRRRRPAARGRGAASTRRPSTPPGSTSTTRASPRPSTA